MLTAAATRRAHLVSNLETMIDALHWHTSVATGARAGLDAVPSHEPVTLADLDNVAYVAQALLGPPAATNDAAHAILDTVRDLRPPARHRARPSKPSDFGRADDERKS